MEQTSKKNEIFCNFRVIRSTVDSVLSYFGTGDNLHAFQPLLQVLNSGSLLGAVKQERIRISKVP